MSRSWHWVMVASWGIRVATAAGAGELPDSIPKDSVFIVHLEIQKLFATPLGRHHLKQTAASARSDDFLRISALRQLGISVLDDVERGTLVLTNLETNDGWLRLQGRFSGRDLYEAASRLAAETPDRWRLRGDEKRWYVEAVASPPIYLQVPEEHVLVITTNKALLSPSDRLAPPKPGIRKLHDNVRDAEIAWMVFLPEALMVVPTSSEPSRRIWEQVSGGWGRLDVDTAFRVEVRLQAADAEVASKLRQFIADGLSDNRKWARELREELPRFAGLFEILEGIRASVNGNEVRLFGEWSGRDFGKRLRVWLRLP